MSVRIRPRAPAWQGEMHSWALGALILYNEGVLIMKRFIAILLVLLMLPLYCFAAGSPTLETKIKSNPPLKFVLAEKTDEWSNILERIEELNIKSYIMIDALYVCLDKEYGEIEWTLLPIIKEEDEPFVLIIDSEAIISQEVCVTNDGAVIVDFTDYEPNNYFICFYIKGAD